LSQSNNQQTFTRFENQYILMLAVRAKQDLMVELKEEMKKIEHYGNTQSFIDPNIRNYIEALSDIIDKAKSNMNEYDKWENEE
jgi:hypothetical protein